MATWPSTQITPPATAAPPAGGGSEKEVGWGFLAALGIAQFGIYVAILSPVYVSLQLKAQEMNPENPAVVLGIALPLGSLGAIIGNPLFGMLSDRTRTRFGRRRPWLIGGILTLIIGLVAVAAAPTILVLTLAWLLCQLGSNAAYSSLMASFADNVPAVRRGRAASILGLAQNVSILAGTYAAVLLVANLPLLFVLPGLVGLICVIVFVIIAPDRLPVQRPEPLSLRVLLGTFWTNPLVHRDFGLAWWSRFLITLATFLFTTYRLLYMQDHLGMEPAAAVGAVANGVLIYTIGLMAATAVSGWASDRLRRRKVFVAGSTLVFGAGLVLLAFAQTVTTFYLAELVMGIAYGVYVAIDYALVVDVLPDPEHPGKDLGVFNIASALPQSFAPALGALLLSVGGGGNYPVLLWGAGAVALIGVVVVLPIRTVR
ncbi:MFS transporter [Brachybacterium kimchii]|uniref:MFS transporter n=1 Tax=Brachybacterium kimchii TaxID=2942909 RepID=A0ABY4N2J5_9MICO|nr:MFS transporter [Brachybacterium kimchii]UQN28772.1 MFS transporter [Brachybacterium kimchii]